MHNDRFYTGLRDSSRWTLIDALEEQGRRFPADLWVQSTDGAALTFGGALHDSACVAGYLASVGVEPGDNVVVMLPNGIEFVRVWLGIGTLGATAVLLNTELRGRFLEHQLNNCRASIAVVDGALYSTLCDAARNAPALKRVIVFGARPATGASMEVLELEGWCAAAPWAGPRPRPQDSCCVMYTSGTSGPAKGVVMPHAHCTLYGIGTIKAFDLSPDDRYYIVLPLFHVNGLLMQLGATLLAGIAAIVRPRFSASGWLADIREHRATVTNTLGTLASFIIAQPAADDDKHHGLRALLNAPNPAEHEAVFRERFGVRDVLSGYGMTEVNIPVWGRLGCSRPGAAGWVHDEHFELIVANPETDRPLPPGELGEILVRPKIAFGFMSRYHAMPEQTVEAWRNLWFHTGDAGTMSADGLLTFVDRIKDCIRRRGENISATEIEAVVGTLEGIAEVSACAVPSDRAGGEDEISLSVVLAAGSLLTPQAIAAHADAALPRFARPRYLEIVPELPKTATGKLQRAVLRKRGVAAAWDRDQ